MFAIIQKNKFVKFLPENTPFEINNVRYPANYLNLSSVEEKAKLGIVDVVYVARPDDKYYWVSEGAPAYADGVVSVAYTATPKDLAECLKQAVSAMRAQAYSLLLPSDWMATKAFETGVAMPQNWAAWRQEIRDQAEQAITDIDACVDIDALATLAPVQWANDPNFIEPSI
tara:strand:- start:4515 stop:5027 length:513 start_codon:yes stop_codon:yes gene_type:complete